MTCPLVTGELKSANNFSMTPLIWLPTSTCVTGFNCPVAGDKLRQFAALHLR